MEVETIVDRTAATEMDDLVNGLPSRWRKGEGGEISRGKKKLNYGALGHTLVTPRPSPHPRHALYLLDNQKHTGYLLHA